MECSSCMRPHRRARASRQRRPFARIRPHRRKTPRTLRFPTCSRNPRRRRGRRLLSPRELPEYPAPRHRASGRPEYFRLPDFGNQTGSEGTYRANSSCVLPQKPARLGEPVFRALTRYTLLPGTGNFLENVRISSRIFLRFLFFEISFLKDWRYSLLSLEEAGKRYFPTSETTRAIHALTFFISFSFMPRVVS